MALYAIGDLHLSLGTNKSMEVFGPAWDRYVERIGESLSVLRPEDTLVLAGDTSWGMSLAEAEADFRFLDAFPGQKFLVKGNHDYWWTTASKFDAFCREKNFHTLHYLHNNCAVCGGVALCGTRGWFHEEDDPAHNTKILNRELQRLETSFLAADGRPIFCFLHYPPVTQGYQCPELLALLDRYPVRSCFYGHLHGRAIRRRFEGPRANVNYFLISADYLQFQLKKICEY